MKGDSKRELAQQKIKLRVYNAFLQLLDETGYDGITATDIIKRSGIARSTFYRHFSSVHDVLIQYGGHLDELFEAKTSGQTPDFFDREYLVKTFSYYQSMRREFDIMREAGLPTQWVDLIARYHEDKLGIARWVGKTLHTVLLRRSDLQRRIRVDGFRHARIPRRAGRHFSQNRSSATGTPITVRPVGHEWA